MEDYITDPLTALKVKNFTKQFDERIGTDREEQPVDGGLVQVYCMELTRNEVQICREIENRL